MYITMCLYISITILLWVLSIYPFIKHYTIVVSIITIQFSHIMIRHINYTVPSQLNVYQDQLKYLNLLTNYLEFIAHHLMLFESGVLKVTIHVTTGSGHAWNKWQWPS